VRACCCFSGAGECADRVATFISDPEHLLDCWHCGKHRPLCMQHSVVYEPVYSRLGAYVATLLVLSLDLVNLSERAMSIGVC
jgi:hypothetical protein